MSNRYKGAVISATPPSVSRGPGAAFASGIWTTSQQMQYQATGTWPLSYDPNFNQTVLLLHGDGTNGAQNNTFLDSSTNNFTITRNGNTTQGSFSPFSLPNGEWSNFFDGNGDYLQFTGSSATQFSTGDFTVACWIYLTSVPAFTTVLDLRGSLAATPSTLNVSSTAFNWYNGSSNDTTGITPAANTWYYLVVSRVSSTTKIFVNGTEYASFSDTTDYSTGTGTIYIGKAWDASNYYVNGYISNFRIIKGSGITTAPVPTSPFTAISGTSLLTCQSNRFVDNSSNAFAITVNGNTSVQPFSPFAPSAAYSPSVNGGSGYFDATGDWLDIPDNAAFAPSTAYTVEAWIYPKSTSTMFVASQVKANDPGNSSWFIYLSGTDVSVGHYSGGGSWTLNIITSGTGYNINCWNHVASVWDGTDLKLYINGVEAATSNITAAPTNSTIQVKIGAREDSASTSGINLFDGYVSSFRFVNNSAVYTSAFTPPTAPLTAVANTSLLCNFTNAGIFDNTGKNNLETVGNAQIDTSVKKYGTGSMEFDGTGDWLVSPSNSLYDLNGDFTIEFWIYLNSLSGNPTPIDRAYTGSALDSNGYLIQYGSSALKFYGGGSSITSSQTDSTSTWFHYAIVRSGSTITMYRNGTSVGSATISTAFTYARELSIGGNSRAGAGFTAGQGAMNGYIDDLRITKGVARYTASFTPPNGPFFNT